MSDPLMAARVYAEMWKRKHEEAQTRIAELEKERDRLKEAIQQAIDLLGQMEQPQQNKVKARRLLAVALAGQEGEG